MIQWIDEKIVKSLFSPADDIGIAMLGMFVVFARSVPLKIIKDFKIVEHLAQSAFLNKVEILAATILGPEGVRLNHSLRRAVFFQFRIEVVPRRHDDNPTSFD